MKISVQILIAATTLSGLAAAAEGYIQPSSLADCVEDGSAAQFNLPAGSCTHLEPFMSFTAGFDGVCAAGKTPTVTAFSGIECNGNSVSAGPLPASHDPGECKEIVVDVGGTVSAGGQSALFECA